MHRSTPRALIRRYSSIAFAALIAVPAVALAAAPATALTPLPSYVVNSTADTSDGAGTGMCFATGSQCTLRAALTETNANTTATVPPITFVAGLGPITLGSALSITKPVTITGAERQPLAAGATIIDGGAKDRVFNVSSTGVTIDGVVIRNGAPAKGDGGGILVNKGAVLNLNKSTITANKAANGAGVEADGTANIFQSTFQGNTASSKGGGLFVAGTANIQNSTFDGNTANGGGGIASPGTTNLTASTVTRNNSNNSNGGGLYRVGGTFNVTSSIIASNNGGTGRDCYGSPTFIGTNILQYTPGCNPSGGTILVTDPQLGDLADNSGATQTRRPLTGSKAIDAYPTPCATPKDQRDFARPTASTDRCDVGSVENQALGVNVSLATDKESIGVGTRHVPENKVPVSSIVANAGPNGTTSSTGMHFTAWHFTAWHFTGMHFTAWHFTGMHFTGMHFTGMHFTGMHFTDAEGFLKAALLPDPLANTHLSDVNLNRPGGWEAVQAAAGPPFDGLTREQVSLADVWPTIERLNITFDQLDFSGTSLASLTLPVLLLGGIALQDLPLNAGLESASQADRLTAWCNALKTPTQDPCFEMKVGPGSAITVLAVALAGFSLENIDLSQILVRDFVDGAAEWLQQTPLMHFGSLNSPLSALPMTALPTTWVNCAAFTLPVTCANATLADAAKTENNAVTALDPSLTLYDLFTNATSKVDPRVRAFSANDYLQAIIPPDLFPWGDVDLSRTPLQNASDQPEPPVTYIATVNVTGDRAAATTVKLTLPPGFAFVPGTLTIDGQTQPTDPVFDATNSTTVNLNTLNPGTVHTVTMQARAGLTLGLEDCTQNQCAVAKATAAAGTDTVTATATKAITVNESFEKGGTSTCHDQDPCDTKPLDANTLLVGHISTPTDRDFYNFNIPNDGNKTSASIILSNLPADYDLVLYGPRPQQIGSQPPQQTLQPVNDAALNLFGGDNTMSPDTVNDVPLTPPGTSSALRVAANRGTVDERIDTGILVPGDYYVQVSGYNGANSPLPYLLRMTLLGVNPPPCAPPSHTLADGSFFTSSTTTPGTNPHVLYVVAQHRMYQTYGAASVTPMLTKLNELAGSVEGSGTILAVDNPIDANTTAAKTAADEYQAWDGNHCDPNAANAVVHQIAVLIDQARQANPQIDSVVLVGDDSVLPMARVLDGTQLANELNYADALASTVNNQPADNELSGGMAYGYFLTDNAYGTPRGVSVNDHEMFVPDVALGRLVETPDDIKAAIQTYLDNKVLAPSTATSALVTGYDFMSDTADAVATTLNNNGKRDVTELKGNWSSSDLTSNLLGTTPPGITNFNGHFDQQHMLAGNGTDAVSSSVLAAGQGNENKLSRRLLFSMGCHSGLSVSDISIGSEFDWPQAITGASQSGVYAGNTGFGYGDDAALALGERLMSLYAQALNGPVSVGQALMLAKQQYAATTAVLSPYDEKVLQESVFYGLPFYGLAAPPSTSNATIHVLTMASSSSGSSATITGTDPRTHLDVAPVSQDISADRVHTGNGDFYQVNGQKIMVQNRPIEPMTTVDATQPNHRAHGFLITSFSTSDSPNFTPRYFRPMVDEAANEQQITTVGDSVFPSTLSRVTHSAGANGGNDTVLITAGQARDPLGDGTVTQRLVNNYGGLVEYSTLADNDWNPATIFRSRGEIVGSTAGFTVDTSGDAVRVYVMYKSLNTDGAWKGVDLTATNLPDGTRQWWGGGPINSNDAEFFVQALDASGNVAFSTNKVSNFLASRLSNNGLSITIVPPAGVTPVNGWYPTTQQLTAFVSGGTGITFSLDGSDFGTYPAAGVPIQGDGVHHFLAMDAAGHTAAADVLIDATGPAIKAKVDPAQGTSAPKTDATNHVWYDGPVLLSLTANDGVIGSGVASIGYHAGSDADTVVNDSSNPKLDRSLLGDASTTPRLTTSGLYTYKATDNAGNVGLGAAGDPVPDPVAINIDTVAPVPNCTVVPPSDVWYTQNVTVKCFPTDSGVGLLSSADAEVDLQTNVAQGSQNPAASTGSHDVCDRFNHCITIGPFTYMVDEKAPTITGTVVVPNGISSAADASSNPWYSGPVNLHLVGDDGADGSGIASITWASQGPFTALPTTVLTPPPAAPTTDVNVTPSGDGTSTVTYTSRDVAGHDSAQGSTDISIDTLAPDVQCTLPSQSQWYGDNVTVPCNATDNGVGLAVGTSATFQLTTSVAPDAQSSSAPTSTQQVCDRLSHCVTVGTNFTFKVDRKAPGVTVTSPTDGASYPPSPSVLAAYSCDPLTDGAPITSCAGPVASGAAIDMTPGTHVFTVTGKDAAGNTTTVTRTYSVGYKICYLYDTTKPQSTGGTVVIKVQLCDANNNNVSSPNVVLTAVAQDFPGPDPPRQLPSPNFQGNSNTGFDFRYSSGTYIYNLDPTQPLPDGNYLGSGPHTLYFVVNHVEPPLFAAPFVLK